MKTNVFAERVLTTPKGASVAVQLRYVGNQPVTWSYTIEGKENEHCSFSEPNGVFALQNVLAGLTRDLSANSEGWHFADTLGTGLELLHPDPDMDTLLDLLGSEEAFRQNCLTDALWRINDGLFNGAVEEQDRVARLRQKIRYRIVALARADEADSALLRERTHLLEKMPVSDDEPTFVVVGDFVRKDTGDAVVLEVHAPQEVETDQGTAWGCDYRFRGLDSEIHTRVLGQDSMGALLSAFESIRIDFLNAETPVGFPDEFGKWDESSEVGCTGFEIYPAEEQPLLEHLAQTEVLRNRLLFSQLRRAPTIEVQQIKEQLLVHLEGAERARFAIHQNVIERELPPFRT